MDETYIKVRGQWVYLYRAVDKAGQTVDFFLSPNRDVNAAKSFLRSAMKRTRVPTKITLDAYAASHRAGGREELHNLASDPGESKDLLKEQPEMATGLKEKVARWVADVEASRLRDFKPGP